MSFYGKSPYCCLCCCCCLRAKARVVVGPAVSGHGVRTPDDGYIRVLTAPGRYIGVYLGRGGASTLKDVSSPGAVDRKHSASVGRPLTFEVNSDRSTTAVEGQPVTSASAATANVVVADSGHHRQSQQMLVTADVERPQTSDTVMSRLSLPPLGRRSSLGGGRKNGDSAGSGGGSGGADRLRRRLRWSLKRRSSAVGDSRKSAVVGRAVAEICDAIVTLPGTNDELSSHVAGFGSATSPVAATVVATSPEAAASVAATVADNDTALFFIHGVGGNLNVWRHQIQFFRQIGFTIVAVNMIGHGSSSVLNRKSAYSFDAIKSDVFAIFDRFARDRNVVVAHSYGTCFAAVLAKERSKQISHLVLISSGAPVPLEGDNDGPFLLPVPIFILLRPAFDHAFRKRGFANRPSRRDFQAAFGVRSKVLKWIMQGQRWATGTFLYHQEIKTPTLLIYGGDDALVSLEEMHQMRKALPRSILEIIDQAGHMVSLEQPNQVNRLIQSFMQQTGYADDPGTPETARRDRKTVRPSTAISRTIPPVHIFRLQNDSAAAGGDVVTLS